MLKYQHLVYMPATPLHLKKLQYKNEYDGVYILSGLLLQISFSCFPWGHTVRMHKGGKGSCLLHKTVRRCDVRACGEMLWIRASAAPGTYFHSYPLHLVPWTAPGLGQADCSPNSDVLGSPLSCRSCSGAKHSQYHSPILLIPASMGGAWAVWCCILAEGSCPSMDGPSNYCINYVFTTHPKHLTNSISKLI